MSISGKNAMPRHDTFDISFLKKDLRQALVQQDKEKVNSVFEELSALFTEFHPAREQVVNACANLYYFFLSYVEEDALIKEEMPYPSRGYGDIIGMFYLGGTYLLAAKIRKLGRQYYGKLPQWQQNR